MGKHTSITLLLLFLTVAVSAQSQRRQLRLVRHGAPSSALVSDYAARLDSLRDSLFADTVRVESRERLPFPLTFDPDLIHRAFTAGGRTTDFEKQLLGRYIAHPKHVRGKMADLDAYYHEPTIGKKAKKDAPLTVEPDFSLQEPALPVPVVTPSGAPIDMIILHPNFWTYHGDYSLQFMQNYISGNWYKGGESHFSALGQVTLQANYNNKQKVKWENKLELKFGIASTRSDSLHSYKTTDDLIRLTSKFGLQATKKWYYTLQLIAQTQFTHSYKSNDATLYSHFLAPGSINLSLGMDYTADWLDHKLKGSFHIAPLAYNLKYTRLLDLSERLGIDEGKHCLHDFGSEFTIDLTWQIIEPISWKTRLYGYTTYKRAELEWENTINMQINRFISAQLFFYPRFDDGVARDEHSGYWQFKEYASIGFAYSF